MNLKLLLTASMAFVIFSAFVCQKKIAKNKLFKVTEATSQVGFGGVAGSGSGTSYSFKLIGKSSSDFSADSLYVSGKVSPCMARLKGVLVKGKIHLAKGDTLELRSVIRDPSMMGGPDNPMTIPGSPNGKPPEGVRGDVVITYQGNKDKKFYISLKFKDLTKKEPIIGE